MLRFSRLAFRGFAVLFLLSAAPPASAQVGAMEGPVLKKQTLAHLNTSLLKWYKADSKANELQNQISGGVDTRGKKLRKSAINGLKKKAAKQRKSARKARMKFQDQFAAAGKSVGGDLLKSVPDLLAIFQGCFPYARISTTGKAKLAWINKKTKQGYAMRTPKPYSEKRPWPLVWVLPNRQGKTWAKPMEFLEKGLPATDEKLLAGYLVGSPSFPADMELDGRLDPTKEEAQAIALSSDRITWFWTTLKDVFYKYHVDTDRVYLSATGESIPFALRIVSMFPDRFAGLILHNPQRSDFDAATVYGNLTGLGVFLAADDKAAEKDGPTHIDHANKIAEGLKAAGHKAVLVEKGQGVAPFTNVLPECVTWLDKTRRNLYPRKYVLMPAHDQFRKAYWVSILEADYLNQVAIADRPRIEVTADPATNKIEVKGRGVRTIVLYLNDMLVNLDKKITLVLNGQVREIKRRRQLSLITNTRSGLVFLRNDPKYLFVSRYQCDLPTPKPPDDEKSGGKAAEKAGGDGGGR